LEDESVPLKLRENIKKYGHPLVGDQERPHITITRMKSADDVERALEILRQEMENFTFVADRIAVTNVGPHGSCPNIIREFSLTS